MPCFSLMFPTVMKQFSMKYSTVVFNELQLNLIQLLTFLPQEAFPSALTVMKVL